MFIGSMAAAMHRTRSSSVLLQALLVLACIGLEGVLAHVVHRRVLESEPGWREVAQHLHAYELHDFSSHQPTRRALQQAGQKTVEYELEVLGKRFLLDLERDDAMFAQDYKHTYLGEDGQVVQEEGPLDCVYSGVDRNLPAIRASVVLCKGLVHATVFHKEDTFTIQPLESRVDSSEHIVYRHRDLKENDYKCGNTIREQHGRRRLDDEEGQHIEHSDNHVSESPRIEPSLRGSSSSNAGPPKSRRNAAGSTKYVGVAIVNDQERFGLKADLTHLHSAALFAKVKFMYTLIGVGKPVPANFDLVLELQSMYTMTLRNLWAQPTTVNPVDVSQLLTNFNAWQNSKLPKSINAHDVAHLYSGLKFAGNVIGLAHVSGVCHSSQRSSVVQANTITDAQMASTSAHELGHNFGAQHTQEVVPPIVTEPCSPAPNGKYYIMAASSSRANMDWERCSAAYFNYNFAPGSPTYDAPSTYSACLESSSSSQYVVSAPRCGDGKREGNEECDCPAGDCSSFDPCCDGATCRLKRMPAFSFNASCSAQDAPCCIVSTTPTLSCTINPSTTTVCRAAVDSGCDTAEYCTGTSARCPRDVFASTGQTCEVNGFGTGTCYFKRCLDPGDQCKNAGQRTWTNTCYRNDGICTMRCAQSAGPCQTFNPPTYFKDGTQCGVANALLGTVHRGCFNGECIPMSQIPLPNCSTTNITDILSINCGNGLDGVYAGVDGACADSEYPTLVCEGLNWFSENPQVWGPILAVLILVLLYFCLAGNGDKPSIAKQIAMKISGGSMHPESKELTPYATDRFHAPPQTSGTVGAYRY